MKCASSPDTGGRIYGDCGGGARGPIESNVLDYCVFGHCSAEQAHRALLEYLQVQPLLDLEMRLGEGSGAAVALSVVRAAVALFTQMATFEGEGVSNKDD
jgi:nicotinate-nucleotide--dimethylbenzimidazole phosphoribosyltransferase